ncbi:hypothetical protein HanIR_Chr17g0880831 [Helianthus annuus]|nr:hypothetical protein HanIR_Chr17g0880831 [Helianthus annuus]
MDHSFLRAIRVAAMLVRAASQLNGEDIQPWGRETITTIGNMNVHIPPHHNHYYPQAQPPSIS